MIKEILCLIGAAVVLVAVVLVGVVITTAQLYKDSPDLYEKWNRLREERKGKK